MPHNDNKTPLLRGAQLPPIPEVPAPTATAEELAWELIEYHLHPEKMTPEQLLDIDDL